MIYPIQRLKDLIFNIINKNSPIYNKDQKCYRLHRKLIKQYKKIVVGRLKVPLFGTIISDSFIEFVEKHQCRDIFVIRITLASFVKLALETINEIKKRFGYLSLTFYFSSEDITTNCEVYVDMKFNSKTVFSVKEPVLIYYYSPPVEIVTLDTVSTDKLNILIVIMFITVFSLLYFY